MKKEIGAEHCQSCCCFEGKTEAKTKKSAWDTEFLAGLAARVMPEQKKKKTSRRLQMNGFCRVKLNQKLFWGFKLDKKDKQVWKTVGFIY